MKILNHCVAIILLSVSGFAGDFDERRYISVSGSAKMTVQPDVLVWRVEMQGLAKSVDEAAAQLDETVIGLKEGAKAAGFGEGAVVLSRMSSGRLHEGHGQKRVFKGFFVKKTAVIELKDLAKREAMEKVLLKDDRVKIMSTVSKSSLAEKLRREVLLLAMKDGKQKAAEMAESVGVKTGNILSVSEKGGERYTPNNGIKLMRSSSQVDASLPAESIDFSASVLLKFEIE